MRTYLDAVAVCVAACSAMTVTILMTPGGAHAQCTDIGGYVGGSITPIVQVQRGSEAFEPSSTP